MIRVTIGREDGLTTLEVTGHSGYAEKGKDIVCAGVSTIVQTYAFITVENGGCEEYRMGDGYLFVKAKDSKENDIRLHMVKTALEAIEGEYPHYLMIGE